MAQLLAGELPDGEAAAVRARISSDPALAKLVRALERADLSTIDATNPQVEVALRRVRMRMHTAPSRAASRYWLPIAAAIVAVAGIFLVTRPANETISVATVAPQVFRTSTGARDSIQLSDGSKVILGPGSELAVSSAFPQAREVTLKGQARFDVVHDAARPFTVRTAQAVITDLGTVFTVNDFDGAAVDVSVQSGTVRLSTARKADTGVVLDAGDAGTITTRGVLTRDARAASDDDLAWMSGRLVFREAPMVKVRAELRRWYGIELVTSDSAIAAGHLTNTFRNESVTQVMDVIALTFGAKHVTRGDTVVLQRR